MSEKKANLKKAREALAAKEWRDVLAHCKSVLKEDQTCYEAYVYVGKAAFQLGEFEQADLSYQKATELNDKAPQAWQGLSELYHETQQWVKAAEADQVLVDLAHRGDAALAAKLPYLVRRLGAAHAAAGQLEEAEVALREVLAHPLPPDERLPVLAQLADVQLREDSTELEAKVQQRLQEKRREAAAHGSKVCEDAVRSAVNSEAADEALELDCDHATPTIKELVCGVAPTPPYVKYHDTYLRRLRQAVNVAAPGTMDRHNRRVAVLEVARAMMEGRCAAEPHTGMGCASPYAFETALRLLEIEEEIAGAHLPRTSSTEFASAGGGMRGSFTSALNSPRSGSGFATPTAAAGHNAALAAAAMLSPGSFFSSSLQLPAAASRVGSLSLGGLPPRSGAATPSAASVMSGAFLPGPATPKRDMSAARLSELVHHPMAAATAAAGATMAEQERESFSQLAAEASTAGIAAAPTANGTPGEALSAALSVSATPVGSMGATVSPNATAAELQSSESLGPYAAAGSFARGLGGLSVAVSGSAAGGGLISRYSSTEMLAAASPRFAAASPRYAGTLTPLTPTRSGIQPAAAPLLMNDREMIGRRLAHAFPWNATAQVHLAMALRRREAYVSSGAATIKLQCSWQGPGVTDLSCSPLAQRLRAERPRQAARKAWLAELLAKGLARGAPVVSGMIGLAELRLEAEDAAGALAAAKQGLKFVFDRSKVQERARHAALVLNLLAGQALLGTGQLTDAGRIFVRLAQRVSEGEVSFGSEAVGMPATSIRQQAIRGLAQVALAQGDTCQALHHYGELVSKALMGRGSAEHWAYAEYGWLLFKEGNADAGRYQLETALDVLYKQAAVLPGCEAVLAGYHYKLARIYWALDGSYRCEREHCLQHLLDAAAEEGPQQAEAFEWLGHWYSQVAHDELRARKCYQRALALNPTLEGAGNALCDLLQASRGAQAASLEAKLLEEMLLRAPDAQWARSRLARLQLQTGQYEQAVASFQSAIRSSPKSAELWEGLAASYQALGRHASALKSYSRALELDPARPYALMSCGALHFMAGAYQDAAQQYLGDPAAAEFSYSRALALDPKAAALWVQLGRLYSRHGSAELAEQCYEAARGAEPTLVSVWEAMAATAAARGSSSAGTAAAAAAAEHAVGLGGGPESWLEYATAGLRGRASQHEGLLLACACKASAHQPLLLPPHAALAAALEARGQHSSAVAALQYCLALLQAGLQQGSEGLAALGLTGFGQGFGQATHRVVLLQAAGFEGSEGVASPESVHVALEIALARNLVLAGQFDSAVQLYGKLEQQGSLGSNPLTSDSYSWVCYGFAAQQLGQAGLCSRVLEQAVEEAGGDTAKLHAVMALLQHHLSQGSLEAAFSLLLQRLPQLAASSPTLASSCTRTWLALVVAAAAAGLRDLQAQVVEVMRQAVMGQLQHVDMAWVECELQCISAAAQAADGAKTPAMRTLAHAVHTCPWHVPARLRLAEYALAGNPRKATAVFNACPGLLPETYTASSSASNSVQLQQLQQDLPGTHSSAPSQSAQKLAMQEVLAAASCRATALSGQVAAAVAAEAGQEVARLRRLLHAMPSSPDLWYCLALAALLQAVGDGQAAHFRRAEHCCLSALNRVEQLIAEQQQQAPASATAAPGGGGGGASSSARSLLSCKLQELQDVKVRLMVAISECHQHSRMPDCQDAAQHWAMDALAAAMAAGGVGASTAHRQVGRMLALRGMVTEAEMAYRQAVTGSGSGGAAAGAVLELAKLLAGHGRQQEAAALLHGIWEGAAAALTSATDAGAELPAAAAAAGVLGPGPQFLEASALEEALLLADLGQWEAARAAAAAGLRLAGAAGDAAPAAAELVTATVALQAAAAAPGEGSRNLLLEARWAASSAARSGMALPGTVGTAAAGIGAAVLAQVELARNKPEKAYDAIGMSFGAWVDQAVPAQVLLAAGELTRQVTDCAAAVHTAPWLEEGWEKLKLAAIAAGRLVDVL
ncbi:hypothetical protein OEZ85_010527 [Tetradesmus obliquus]|uniref:UDP-N-acetylglucosamine--peptide N-acetylglucosaminyltransferase SPINDLY n=1 Tax=Tetradesmus obliquus TaxID=3088 RepID=A0ABY8TMU8_TETOB|nr:hypothetical protein OEZ85_010527 [Tetradesmus obliquus]